MYFCIDSDLHFAERSGAMCIRPDKAGNAAKVLEAKKRLGDALKTLIVAGDLTENGSDGAKLLGIPISGPQQQLQGYVMQYASIVEAFGVPILETVGNHDLWTYFPYYSLRLPIQKYVEDRHGKCYYVKNIDGVLFICLGKYPDKESLLWLQILLGATPKTTPLVIFFHFNLEGSWSDWWIEQEKQAFYDRIVGYNVLALICGHRHTNTVTLWRGYKVIMAGGSGLSLCKISDDKTSVDVVEWL